MKKLVSIILALVLVIGLLAGCGGNAGNSDSKTGDSGAAGSKTTDASNADASTPDSNSSDVKPTYVIDFEKPDLLVGPTVCFDPDPEFTKTCLKFEPQEGFAGNVYKGIVKAKQQGATWWVSGVTMSKEGSKDAEFKDLKYITFKYTSTVEYLDPSFIVQLVWKDKSSGDTVATIETEFKMEKTSDIKTFKIDVPEDIKTDLNSASNFYLDWFMVGLKDNIGDAFRPGTFCIDDISFYNK